MRKISLGAEVYTWFMSEGGKTYENQLGHMIEMVAKSGFTGIEPMHFWMGDWADPLKLADKLNEHNIKLKSLPHFHFIHIRLRDYHVYMFNVSNNFHPFKMIDDRLFILI